MVLRDRLEGRHQAWWRVGLQLRGRERPPPALGSPGRRSRRRPGRAVRRARGRARGRQTWARPHIRRGPCLLSRTSRPLQGSESVVEIREELPRNPGGKVVKSLLRSDCRRPDPSLPILIRPMLLKEHGMKRTIRVMAAAPRGDPRPHRLLDGRRRATQRARTATATAAAAGRAPAERSPSRTLSKVGFVAVNLNSPSINGIKDAVRQGRRGARVGPSRSSTARATRQRPTTPPATSSAAASTSSSTTPHPTSR